MRGLTAAIVARHADLSSRQHVLRRMGLGSGTNGHHVEGFGHQMMGVYRNEGMRHVTSHYHQQKTRFSVDRVAIIFR
jgi:hypothetical protein